MTWITTGGLVLGFILGTTFIGYMLWNIFIEEKAVYQFKQAKIKQRLEKEFGKDYDFIENKNKKPPRKKVELIKD